jgi:multiple sugar transport system permease protein
MNTASTISKGGQPATSRTRLRDRLEEDGPLGYLLISPAFLFLLILLAYPFVLAIFLSLTDKRLGATPNFIGLNNFIILAATPLFWKVFWNSMVYTVVTLVLKAIGGMVAAFLLNRDFVGRRFARAALLLPWIVPTAFSTLAWWWMLDPAFGIINVALKRWGLIETNIPFLTDPTVAMLSVILVNVWRGLPFFAIVFLAALQTVPEELVDAGKIDGANSWQRFWKIIIPLILPVVIIVVLISTFGTVSDFELPFLLTRGGPSNATNVFGIYTYNLSIESGLYGLGSAVVVTMFPILAILLVLSVLEIRRED